MTTTINNEHKKLNVPNKREQNQTCLDSAEREGLRPKGNVPNLRFPEFQREWEKCRLGDVCTFLSGGTPKIDVKEYWNGTIPFVSAISMHDTYILDSKLHISEEGLKHGSRLLTKDNLLLLVRGSMLWNTIPICLNKNDVAFNQDVKGIIANDTINNEFLLYWLKSKEQRLKYMVTGTGLGAGKLDTSDLLSMIVYIPAMKEQDKVTRLLSLFDERIATQNKIIDKLQSLIKGIVDSTISCKPKNSTIGNVCSVSEQIKAVPNLDDIITVRLHGKGVCKSSVENLQLGATQYYHRKAGQLIYGKQNFHNGAIGIVPENLNNAITSKDIPSFDIKSSKCNPLYLLIQLQSPQYYKPAESLTTGTGSKRLKEETFLKMPIFLPDKERQDGIATLISSIMMKLNQADKTLNLLIKQKQYLLRQMFI